MDLGQILHSDDFQAAAALGFCREVLEDSSVAKTNFQRKDSVGFVTKAETRHQDRLVKYPGIPHLVDKHPDADSLVKVKATQLVLLAV